MSISFAFTQKTPMISDLRRREFGQRVRTMRKQAGLSREQLADRTNIPFKTVGDIERGEKVSLDVEWVVRPLADFFALKGVAREEFFAAAGLRLDVLQPEADQDQWTELHTQFYRSTSYPAFVTDPLFNLHSTNAYFNALYGLNPADAQSRWMDGAGLNLIRLLLDPASGFRLKFGSTPQALRVIETSLYAFRVSAVSRLGTPAHDKLMRELSRLPDFADLWLTISAPSYKPRSCTLSLGSPHEGARDMQFMCAFVFPTRLDQTEHHHILYIPADDATARQMEQWRVHRRPVVYHYSRRHLNGYREIALE